MCVAKSVATAGALGITSFVFSPHEHKVIDDEDIAAARLCLQKQQRNSPMTAFCTLWDE